MRCRGEAAEIGWSQQSTGIAYLTSSETVGNQAALAVKRIRGPSAAAFNLDWRVVVRAVSLSSELDGAARPEHERILNRLGRIERVGHVAARMDDLLQVALEGPPGRQLQAVVELQQKLLVAHRKEAAGEHLRIHIERGGIRADLRVGDAEGQ